MALQREHGRPHEQLEADERGDRVTGQPEDQGAPTDAERDRLAGLHRHAPEHLFDAELRLRRTDEVVDADRDAARRHEHVGLEPALDRRARRRLVVGHRGHPVDLRTRAS